MTATPVETVFHYTDLYALKSIIDKGELWLSHVHFMNDHTEYNVNLSLIKEGLRRKVEEYAGAAFEGFKFVDAIAEHPVYLASFCIEGDLLSQWRGYCPVSGGYAIEFDNGLLKSVEKRKDMLFRQCTYIKEVQKAEIAKSVENIFSSFLGIMQGRQKIEETYTQICNSIILSLQFKDWAFREENEIRLVSVTKDVEPSFRVKGSVLIPYTVFGFDVNSIKRIIIGPMKDQFVAKKGLELYLKNLAASKKHPLSKVPEISFSEVPLRYL